MPSEASAVQTASRALPAAARNAGAYRARSEYPFETANKMPARIAPGRNIRLKRQTKCRPNAGLGGILMRYRTAIGIFDS
ncbi:hypothetical protein LFI54_001017 [Neisseria gonorrhoeae]